jgi:group II intron reverse transcriptase/maturase
MRENRSHGEGEQFVTLIRKKGRCGGIMRNPIEVLNNLSEKSKNPEYRFERLYRNLYNPEFYLLAYKNIYANKGSMTPGINNLTIDGMSSKRIERLIASLKAHTYQPSPARREYIAKENSDKKRPLGIPSGDDKLVQEVVRMILESMYEPTFSDSSHGFRPHKSCHTALMKIQNTFTGAKWFIEGDIQACFDSFDHHVLVEILRKRINDEAFIALMWKFLKAGYMEQWEYHKTYSGTPQGSGISPILANIYLHELDKHIEPEFPKRF